MKKSKIDAVAVWLATGFGLGLSPVAPGTVGTLLGVVIVGLMHLLPGGSFHAGGFSPLGSLYWQIPITLALILLSVPICHRAEQCLGKKDDGRIVADEYVTYPLCMLALPFNPVILLVAFLTHRFFDILKPPPAYQLQSIPGGAGIVADDVMAAIYSLAVNHAVFYFLIGPHLLK